MRPIEDIRDVLGMRTPVALALAGLFATLQLAALIVSRLPQQSLLLLVVVWLIFTGTFVGVALLPGDPMSLGAKLALVVAGPVATAVGYSQLSAPLHDPFQSSFVTSAVAYLTFMCVRGAIAWAWLGFAATMGVGVAWGLASGAGLAYGGSLILGNAVPVMMATFFGRTVRPTARSILLLREQSNLRAADEAAAVAVLHERDEQLGRLDAIARPMLDVIASGRQLTAAEQVECCLIEAELRDLLRGSMLADPAVTAAARAARAKGVTVVLLDDGGLAGAGPHLVETVRTTTASAIDTMSEGSFSARVLPPGRDQVLAVIGRNADAEFRVGITADGTVRSDIDLGAARVSR